MSLETVVNKFSFFLRRYKNTLRRVLFLSLALPVLGYHLYNNKITKPRAERELSYARSQGKIERVTNQGTIYLEDIRKKHVNQVYDEKEKGFITVYNSAAHHNYYPFACGITLALAFFLIYDQKKNPLVRDLSASEKLRKALFEIGSSAAVLGAASPYLSTLQPLPFVTIGSTAGVLAVALGQNIFHRNHTRSASKSQDVNSLEYNFSLFRSIQGEAQAALKRKDLSRACNLLLQEMRIVRRLDNRFHIAYSDYVDVTKPLRHLGSRVLARRNPTYNNYLKLVLDDVVALTPALDSDLERAASDVEVHELEFRTLAAEFAYTPEMQRKRWITLYGALTRRNAIRNVSEASKNQVGYVDCQSLGLQYVTKKADQTSLEEEIEQTRVIKAGLAGEEDIIIPDIVINLTPDEINDPDNNGVLVQSYESGRTLTDYLRRASEEEIIGVLERATDANALTSSLGLSQRKEDRYGKVLKEISSLYDLGILNRRRAAAIEANILVCLKFADLFPSVYDRDGHGDNILVSDSNRLVILDHEARDKSDPAYMLVKLLEHNPVLPHDDYGFSIRNILIERHFSLMDHNANGLVCQAHYYSSIVLKNLSYLAFSSNTLGKEPVRQGYIRSARFGLDMLLSWYSRLYNSREISMFKTLRGAI